MGTVIRPEVSKKNEYWIEKQRYYELKHFCMQYGGWKRLCEYIISGMSKSIPMDQERTGNTNSVSDPTAEAALIINKYTKYISIVDNAVARLDSDLGKYVFKGVTEGLSYAVMSQQDSIPYSKDIYYDEYRKFFYILDQIRD